ncbi:replication initiation protein [Enterococcus sp. LJL99]
MDYLDNTSGLRRFDVRKMNLMVLICFKISQEKSDSISFDFEELEKYIKINFSDLEKSNYFKELTQMSWVTKEAGCDTYSPVFINYEVNRENKLVYFLVNKKVLSNLEMIGSYFDINHLKIFLSISSSYAKTAYYMFLEMKAFDNYTISIECFKHVLAIPSSYKMSDIDKKVFSQMEAQLERYFPSFTIEKINKGRGNTIGYLKFHLFD